MNDIDALNTHFEREHNREVERALNGCCHACGAKFLIGKDDAEVVDGARVFFMCFWCWENETYDPSDPKPSQYHYGNC